MQNRPPSGLAFLEIGIMLGAIGVINCACAMIHFVFLRSSRNFGQGPLGLFGQAPLVLLSK